MAFFQRVMNYLLNEVLVNTLANSQSFQRFAVRSNQKISEVAQKAAQTKSQVHGKGDELASGASEFISAFREEFVKGFSSSGGGGKSGGGFRP